MEQFIQYRTHYMQIFTAISHQFSASHFLQKILLASIYQSQETQEVYN